MPYTTEAELTEAVRMGSQSIRALTATPRYSLIRRFFNFFGEHNFEAKAVDLKPQRDHTIKLLKIALGGAERLNGRSFTVRHGPALHLDDDEIVTVLCNTINILSLNEKVRNQLDDLRLPAHTRPDAQ